MMFLALLASCKKLVEVGGPETSVNSGNIFNNDATAIGAATSLYLGMSASGVLTDISIKAGLSADELIYYPQARDPALAAYYQNNLTSSNPDRASYWYVIYSNIYQINAAIEGLSSSKGLTPVVKERLIGEMKFMRAFFYFYLVNFFGDAPLVLSTDYTVNALITKSSASMIYDQIVKDLKEAQVLLSPHYMNADLITAYPNGAEERVRPNKWAATALLARVYLFTDHWSDAEIQSSLIIENDTEYKLESLDQAFLKNNMESIWQLQPTNIGYNTKDGNLFVLPPTGPSVFNPVYLSDEVLKVFENTDKRKAHWIGLVNVDGIVYHFPFKYKLKQSNDASTPVNEYTTVFRLAEQYLIRAEARGRQGNLPGSIADLDKIRGRAGLELIGQIKPDISKDDLLTLILKERQRELFTEWGHRWLDLKRLEKVDEVMKVITLKKGNAAGWKSYQQYYPIPLTELKANPNLTQISGY